MATRSSWSDSSKTMEDFKHLSYYDQLREIERHLVKLQDSYRRIPSEVPSYEIKEEEPEADHLQSMRKSSERAAEIVDRMKRWQTRSESQNFPEATQDSVAEADHDDCYATSTLGANSEEQNCEMNLRDEFGGAKQYIKFGGANSDLPANSPDFQSIEPIESIEGVLESPHTESICDSMEDMHSPSEEHRDRVDPAPSTQEPGPNLGAISEEQNREMVYSSTKESIADIVGGNKSLYKLQLLAIDGQEIDQYPTKLKIKTGMDDLGKTLGAYYVFDKMSTREIALPQFSTTLKKSDFTSANGIQCYFLYVDIGKNLVIPHGCSRVIFDPGGVFALFVTKISRMTSFWSGVEVTMEAEFFYLKWQWDPGGTIVLVAEILC